MRVVETSCRAPTELGARGTPNPYLKAERELNLAALYGTRRNGDPNQNLEWL